MALRVDLHSHSTASDGALSPAELVRRAAAQGVGLLALTDHDTVAGLDEAGAEADRQGLRLVPGVELSVAWQRKSLHVVALGVDPAHPALRHGLARLQEIRAERARRIGARLAKHGVAGAWEGASALAGAGQLTRSHYARYLVEAGYCRDAEAAFKRFLARGRPGYVAVEWVAMEEALAWIRAAGGLAVLAHPLAYRLTGAWLRRVLEAFREAGGTALEVVAGQRTQPQAVQQLAGYAHKYRLLASIGSDFHSPANPHVELGRLPPLPQGLEPVWSRWL